MHRLERESRFYFDMKFFEDMILDGKWEDVEQYLSSFTKVDDNRYSTKIYFEIRKQNFFEALDGHDIAKALNILKKDLKDFAPGNEELFKELAQLLTLDDISLNWQHVHCANPQPNPDINTLFVDHVCQLQETDFSGQSSESNALPPQTTQSPSSWNFSSSMLTDSAVSFVALSLSDPTNKAVTMDRPEDSDILSEKSPVRILNEQASTVTYPGVSLKNIPDYSPKSSLKKEMFQSFGETSFSDFPKTVAQTLIEGSSSPMSMDFHPVQHTLLLVGTNVGDTGLWDVNSGQKLFIRNFKVWDIGACSMLFKTALVRDPGVSVNRVVWSPDGVAYSKHIVQLYAYHGGSDARQQLEVWDAVTGSRTYSFEGHGAPVYSLCPHAKENIHFIFSISVDGKIKAWLYDSLGARVDYDAPGLGCTRMAYSANGRRLFSCGTSKEGESFLVEWNESEGAIKRTYQGLQLQHNSVSVVHFDTAKDQILAAGDDHVIKIWDMNKVQLLTTIDAGGGLPENPRICFNKNGTLLAVIANENRIKILETPESNSVDAAGVLSDNLRKLSINPISTVTGAGIANGSVSVNEDPKDLMDVKPEISVEAENKSELEKPLFARPSECQSLLLPSKVKANKISRLTYNNGGQAIFALASNGVHLMWRWPRNDLTLSTEATTKVPPRLYQPRHGPQFMVNDTTDSNSQEAVPCFALSKNDAYLFSASGGVISLYIVMTFKTILTIMPPSPTATSLAFNPHDNNVIAIGMDDSTILIYNARSSEVISKLEGHSKRVTGLVFSDALNILVSSGGDAQIFVWDVDGWGIQTCRSLQTPDGVMTLAPSETHIQFHKDQTRFLLVHETHLAIYEAEELTCLKQWFPISSVPISQATFSCDCRMVFTSFVDGTLSIHEASNLEVQCRILSTAYLRPTTSCLHVYPHAIAAHPLKPTQFAVGLTNGEVYVIEPNEPGDTWAVLPPDEIVGDQPTSTSEGDRAMDG
ncbi:Topless-related protein 1 [Citrus sinensis]|uniref:Topless-related protein 1 n=2 Tax=Citrus sinensis TaxID=2711 RepID=A0ACB8NNL1_CITSI|nr:Topless-related protein 1 [Citrus sinensis]